MIYHAILQDKVVKKISNGECHGWEVKLTFVVAEDGLTVRRRYKTVFQTNNVLHLEIPDCIFHALRINSKIFELATMYPMLQHRKIELI